MNYIRTHSGRKFFTTPTPDQVDLEDIATALSRVPRFGGHSFQKYSVAAHSLHVSFLVPKHLQLQALFHDASEAYISDIPSPFKALMPDYKKIEDGIMRAVAGKFGFDWPKDPIVKTADSAALYMERDGLFILAQWLDNEVIPYVKPPVDLRWDFNRWSVMQPEDLACQFYSRANHLLKNDH